MTRSSRARQGPFGALVRPERAAEPVRASGKGPRVAAADAATSGRPAKRSFTIAGHRTSISLEAEFWEALKALAAERGQSAAELLRSIDAARGASGLSSAVRSWILRQYRWRTPRPKSGP